MPAAKRNRDHRGALGPARPLALLNRGRASWAKWRQSRALRAVNVTEQ